MTSIKQKLIALSMILTFSMSALPVYAIGGSQVSTYTLNGNSSSQKQTKLQLVGDAKIKNGTKRVSVSLRDSNVKQALRMFADKAGLNIIFHDSVEDKNITLDLVGVSLQDAIRMVMQASDLSYFVDGDTLIIMSAEASKELNISKQNMMVLPVKYSDATDIAKFLNTNIFSVNKPGLSNSEIVAVDPAKNQLVIFGTQSDYDMAKNVLEMLDTPVRVTNFKVNHVTPKEMSDNLCMALVKGYNQDDSNNGSNSSNNNNNNNNDNDDDDDDDDDSSSGSGSSGQSSGLSAGSAGGNKVKLGKAKLACVTGDASNKKGQGGGQQQQQQGSLYSLNRNGLKVMYYETLGLISVVGGSQDQLDTIAAYITATDIKQPMAYLEFSIIELSEDGIKDFESSWSFISQNFSIAFDGGSGLTRFGGSGGVGEATESGFNPNPIAWITNDRRGNNKYSGTATVQSYFSYLITNNKAKTLANPKILVTSGKESVIDLSSDYLKTLKATTTQTVSGPSTSYDPQLGSDAGIIISVTPFISKDGYVVMNLGPTYATTGQAYTNSSGEILATPLIRRNLELSNVRVKDGDTLIIGGLIQEGDSEITRKMPILGDIPVLGFFFRSTRVQKTKQELVILITPHIVTESEDLVTTGNDKTNL